MEHSGPIRLVIGDDHDALRQGVVAFLNSEPDIEIVGEACDGQQLLAMIERRQPDVTVSDLRMPVMDGIELCRQVEAKGLSTALVLYTAFSDPQLLESALEAGARGFVLKSGPPGDLLRAVRSVHAGTSYVDATLSSALQKSRGHEAESVLSRREREVLQLIADGLENQSVASQLFLEPESVDSSIENAIRKLGCRNVPHAVASALRSDLIH